MLFIYEDTKILFLTSVKIGQDAIMKTMSAFNASNYLLSASSKKSSTAFAIFEFTELVLAK